MANQKRNMYFAKFIYVFRNRQIRILSSPDTYFIDTKYVFCLIIFLTSNDTSRHKPKFDLQLPA
ncbi:MAG: hypothetical protein ACRC77_03030 [Bacteroidales bacterium]